MKISKKKKKRLRLVGLLLIIFLISLVCFIFLFKGKGNSSSNKYVSKIVGEWTTDGVTVYKFNKDNTGELIVPLSNYKFDYTIGKDKLSIDFVDKDSKDYDYTYSFKDGKLVLKGKNGDFIFKKK